MKNRNLLKKKIVFIPVETEVRELDYKIMLAAEIADKETICFVGQHNLLNKLIKNYVSGVYFGKNIFPEWFPCRLDYYYALKKQDFSLLYYHEEGGVWFGSESEWKGMCRKHIDPTILQDDDKIFCWGSFQEEYYKSIQSNVSVFDVGAARLDLAPNMNLGKLINISSRVTDRDYILINTNFSAVNHFLGFLGWYKNMNNPSRPIDQRIESMHWYSSAFQAMGFFLKMLTRLVADYPTRQFILRPHPTESIAFYEEFFKNFKNIKITKAFSAAEWINSCKLLIQNGCTTSIEAQMMGKNVVSYFPPGDKHGDIVNDIGLSASSYNEIKNYIDNLDNMKLDKKQAYRISPLVSNFNSNKSSVSMLAQFIRDSLINKERNEINIPVLRMRVILQNLLINLKELSRFFIASKRSNIKMFRSHFPGFKRQVIEEKSEIANKILEKNITVQYISKDLFLITE